MEKMVMSVAELAEALGVSAPKAYELTNRADFPVLTVGRRKVIPIEAFKTWLANQTAGKAEPLGYYLVFKGEGRAAP